MREFAKIFTVEPVGQVLLYKDVHPETLAAAVVVMIDGHGKMRPQTTLSFSSQEKRDEWFVSADEATAHEWGQRLSDMLDQVTQLATQADTTTAN